MHEGRFAAGSQCNATRPQKPSYLPPLGLGMNLVGTMLNYCPNGETGLLCPSAACKLFSNVYEYATILMEISDRQAVYFDC